MQWKRQIQTGKLLSGAARASICLRPKRVVICKVTENNAIKGSKRSEIMQGKGDVRKRCWITSLGCFYDWTYIRSGETSSLAHTSQEIVQNDHQRETERESCQQFVPRGEKSHPSASRAIKDLMFSAGGRADSRKILYFLLIDTCTMYRFRT